MQQFRVEVSILVVAVFLILSPASSASQALRAAGAKWPRARVVLAVSNSLTTASNIEGDAIGALRGSIETWSSAADVRIEAVETDAQDASPKGVRGDGISLITAAPTAENLRFFPDQEDSPAASTRIFTDRRGNIIEADIVLNPFVKFSTDGAYGTFSLRATITHEIGHLLGLDHSPVWGSVMFDKAAPSFGLELWDRGKLSLPAVDASSLRALYGAATEDAACCGVIMGRLNGIPMAAKGRNLVVWLEDVDTGRMVAATSVREGAQYELAGVSAGSHRLRVAAEIGEYSVASAESAVVVEVAELVRNDFNLTTVKATFSASLVGSTPQIAKLPARFSVSGPKSLFVGGKWTDSAIAEIRILGTDLSFRSEEFRLSDYGSSVRVIGIDLPLEPKLGSCIYSLVIEDTKGIKRYLIGALVVAISED
jgi:hypothetical protein